MKESRFNLFYPARSNPNKILAYNSKSNALATINKDDFDRFKKCSQKGVYDLDEEFLENLKRGNFLIEDDVDELDVLRYQQQSTRYNSSYLGLTIAPTLGCNFRCVYCYEKEHDDIHFMREDVQKDLLRLIEEKCKKLDLLSVAWYGGEPLLAFDLVKSLSKKFIEIIYVFLTIFLYLLKCPQSLILSALRAFCFCGKPHISRSIFLYFRYQAWLKSW